MESAPLHERLRSARAARGEDLSTLSARTGLRVHHIRAIEDGRFGDLPAGIYGRSAVRSFAAAYGLDPEAALAECRALVPQVEDPIDGLARARGVPPHSERAAHGPTPAIRVTERRWRPFAAAVVDGAVTGAVLLALSAAAALSARVSIGALGPSAIFLFLVGLIFGAAYYVWVGGLAGRTFGEYAVRREPLHRDPRPLTLRAIALRTMAAASADARAFYAVGMWVGRRLTRAAASRTVPPNEPWPSPPPPRDREEALTWSMNQRASVPPPPLHPRHG